MKVERSLNSALYEGSTVSKCGLTKNILNVKEAYGKGSIIQYKVDGISIAVCDMVLNQPLVRSIYPTGEDYIFFLF